MTNAGKKCNSRNPVEKNVMCNGEINTRDRWNFEKAKDKFGSGWTYCGK
jgi:hypothetical protein